MDAEQNRRISELEKRVANLQRVAQVMRVHEDTGKVDVTFEGLPLKNIPIFAHRAGEDKTYWLPSEGEFGMLFAPSGDLANAFFMPGINYSFYPVPDVNDENKIKRIFRDGTEEEIDTNAHSYKLKVGDSDDYRRETSETEIKDTFETSHIKIDGSETEIKRTAGKIIAQLGLAKLEITATAVNIELNPAVKINMGVAGITVTAPIFNIIGIPQVGGVPLIVP